MTADSPSPVEAIIEAAITEAPECSYSTLAELVVIALRAAGYVVARAEPTQEALDMADDKLQRGFGPRGVWSVMLAASAEGGESDATDTRAASRGGRE